MERREAVLEQAGSPRRAKKSGRSIFRVAVNGGDHLAVLPPDAIISASAELAKRSAFGDREESVVISWKKSAGVMIALGACFAAGGAVHATVAITGLTIVPTFDGSITGDPTAAGIEAAINSAIGVFHQDFANPITVPIYFTEMSSGLGQSNYDLTSVTYSDFRTALASEPVSSVRSAALASLPNQTTDPIPNATINTQLWLSAANTDALVASGQLSSNYYTTPQYDGTISLNTSSTYTGPGSVGPQGNYSLETVVLHEIDEVLGLGSALPSYGTTSGLNAPRPEDLYRYGANGSRSFSTSATSAYFSLNGTTDLAQFNNANNGGDYGDWASNPLPAGASPEVQDAFITSNANIPLGPNEFAALQAIGYVQVPDATPLALLAAACGTAMLLLRRRHQTC